MTTSLTRRSALIGSLAAVVSGTSSSWSKPQELISEVVSEPLRRLEQLHGGRLGVAILDLETGRQIAQRGSEMFAMCSTFKFLAAAHVLYRVDRKEEQLERRVVFPQESIVTWSPVTKLHTDERGMSIAELCEAAITQSDNTAGNLMLQSFGGPKALTKFVRTLGDSMTRLDRWETALNEAKTGDPRDTTTPTAMLANMKKLLLGNVLSEGSRKQLITWLVANKTGGKRFRAALPADWRIGDKTGTGGNGATNDIAIIWPPNRKPILAAAYYAESDASDEQRNAVLAEVGRLIAKI